MFTVEKKIFLITVVLHGIDFKEMKDINNFLKRKCSRISYLWNSAVVGYKGMETLIIFYSTRTPSIYLIKKC